MTKFQALYVLYLRHESMYGCSWRALAAHYYNRYTFESNLIPYTERVDFGLMTFGGNQIDGIYLEEEAFKILIPDPLFKESSDLYKCDLTRIHPDFNIKNHQKI